MRTINQRPNEHLEDITMDGHSTGGGEVARYIDGVQPEARVSSSTADRDHDADKVDAVAGSEFVDDRIRLRD